MLKGTLKAKGTAELETCGSSSQEAGIRMYFGDKEYGMPFTCRRLSTNCMLAQLVMPRCKPWWVELLIICNIPHYF